MAVRSDWPISEAVSREWPHLRTFNTLSTALPIIPTNHQSIQRFFETFEIAGQPINIEFIYK